MKKKYLFSAIILVVLLIGAAAFALGKKPLAANQVPAAQIAHAYNDSASPIKNIELKVFYAVPKDKVANVDQNWKIEIAAALDLAVKFHALQFRGASALHYDIFPNPIVLKNEGLFYDTTSTNNGNPHALINVGEEIEARILMPGGDLYDAAFAATSTATYPSMAIFYEGVGASGGVIYDETSPSVDDIAKQWGIPSSIIYPVNINSANGFFLVNRGFLTQPDLKGYGSSIVYHEFAHTIGIPDAFDGQNAPYLTDIMGTGRYEPIENTYLDRSILKAMGL